MLQILASKKISTLVCKTDCLHYFSSGTLKKNLKPNRLSTISLLIKQDCAKFVKQIFPCNHRLGSKSPWLGVMLNVFVFMYTCLKSKIVPQAKLELPFCKGYLQYTKSSIQVWKISINLSTTFIWSQISPNAKFL